MGATAAGQMGMPVNARCLLNLLPGLRVRHGPAPGSAAARYPCSRPGVPRSDWHPARTGRMPDVVRLPAQDQKSMLACGSVVAVQNSVTLPSRTWATLATGISIDLSPREADSVHNVTACSSLASTS